MVFGNLVAFQEHTRRVIVEKLWILETDGQPFEIRVPACPPARKKFQLWETWAGSLSYVVGQVEVRAALTSRGTSTTFPVSWPRSRTCRPDARSGCLPPDSAAAR
jgi:hypothetical protein